MHRRLTLMFLFLLAPLSVPACHGSDGTGMSSADEGPAAELACTKEAQAYCTIRKTCWPDGENDARYVSSWGNFQGCLVERKRVCLDDLSHRGTGLTPARTTSCAQALGAQSCADFNASVPLPSSACPPVVRTLANGEACVASNQCVSSYCDRRRDQACGKCADRVGVGKSCDQNSDCASGLACITDPTTMVSACAQPPPAPARAKAGDACGMGLPACDAGFGCVGSGQMRSCQPLVATVGASCDPSHKMAPDCDDALQLWCNRVTMLCEKRKVAAAGESCAELPDGSYASCSARATCVRPRDATTMQRPKTGTCVAAVEANATCFSSGSDGPGCVSPLRCLYDTVDATTGKCRPNDDKTCGK